LQRNGSCTPGCGACCKGVSLNINPAYLEKEVRHWLELHGIKLSERGGGVWAWVPLPCRELQPDMKCGLYGKPERPSLCDKWPFNDEEVIVLEEVTGEKCTFYFTEGE
jgi:hypothetical protein